MPELPDVVVYVDALTRYLVGREIRSISIRSPFVLRTTSPDPFSAENRQVLNISRLGKRIVWTLENSLYLVFHLMIAGRFHWRKPGIRPTGKNDLIAFGFEHGVLMFTEASAKKRASLYVLSSEAEVRLHDPRGLEVLDCSREEFAATLRRENHTVKRALTDPSLLSGIGNAYSDEILHQARMSPVRWTSRLTDDEMDRLFDATRSCLRFWADKLMDETGDGFPEKVTAFRPEMSVHGRFGKPCPVCGDPVQRIVFAENETNYCATCQTGGKLLADRSLSRLLKSDWPKTLDDW